MPVTKRAIPQLPKSAVGTDRQAFDSAVKENLEVIMGQRVAPITTLALTASQTDIIRKLNELIDRVQD